MTTSETLLPPQMDPKVRRFLNEIVYFQWWVRLSNRAQHLSPRSQSVILICVSLSALAFRLWAQTKPGNYDFNLWVRSSRTVLAGGDPYSEHHFNYAPVWLGIITVAQWITGDEVRFRVLLAVILTVVDVAIAIMLNRRGYLLAACLFLLSPVTIAISGQHQQVDGLAVALALGAMLALKNSQARVIQNSDWLASILLGLSLSTKHIFLVFPLWLAMRAGWSLGRRLLFLLVPLGIFGVALGLTSLRYSREAVIHYVLEHVSTDNSPLINTLVPHQFSPWVIQHGLAKMAFVILLVLAALIFRRIPVFEYALMYMVSALLFSWAVANQYLTMPMATIAIYLNLGFLTWLMMSSIYLAGSPGVLDVPFLRSIQQNVLLDYNWVAKDLFPWLLLGWLVMVSALRKPGLMKLPRKPE